MKSGKPTLFCMMKFMEKEDNLKRSPRSLNVCVPCFTFVIPFCLLLIIILSKVPWHFLHEL